MFGEKDYQTKYFQTKWTLCHGIQKVIGRIVLHPYWFPAENTLLYLNRTLLHPLYCMLSTKCHPLSTANIYIAHYFIPYFSTKLYADIFNSCYRRLFLIDIESLTCLKSLCKIFVGLPHGGEIEQNCIHAPNYTKFWANQNKNGVFNFLFFVNPILEDVPVAGAQTIIQVSQNRPVGIVWNIGSLSCELKTDTSIL